MHRPGTPRFLLLLASVASAACLVASCTWYAWVPEWTKAKRRVVVDPAERSRQLAFDAPYVGELDCFAQTCRQRFRLVVPESGQLTVRGVMELTSQDDQARIVLESITGVLGQAGTGRGDRTDAAPLALRRFVEQGTYFVLVQSVGGPLRYELTATLVPEFAPEPEEVPEIASWARPEMLDPPPKLVQVVDRPVLSVGYDDAVRFRELRTFSFPRLAQPGERAPEGVPLEQPLDRQLRRLVTEVLEIRGFRQAGGLEEPDMMVLIATSAKTRSVYNMNNLYDQYAIPRLLGVDSVAVNTRGKLSIDIVDTGTSRLAWHGWTQKGLGPGITPGERTDRLLREAVTEVLAKFPPR